MSMNDKISYPPRDMLQLRVALPFLFSVILLSLIWLVVDSAKAFIAGDKEEQPDGE